MNADNSHRMASAGKGALNEYTLNMDISFGNGNSILKLLRGVSHSQIEFGVGIQSKWSLIPNFCSEEY